MSSCGAKKRASHGETGCEANRNCASRYPMSQSLSVDRQAESSEEVLVFMMVSLHNIRVEIHVCLLMYFILITLVHTFTIRSAISSQSPPPTHAQPLSNYHTPHTHSLPRHNCPIIPNKTPTIRLLQPLNNPQHTLHTNFRLNHRALPSHARLDLFTNPVSNQS